MTLPFLSNPHRDAWKAIKGFYYQVELTVQRWLELQEDTVLYCECGEDIDHVKQLLATDDTDTDTHARLLEQIKTRERITLRNPAALTPLARFRETVVSNPTLHIFYRFSTTAIPGQEHGIQFPHNLTGIAAWNAVRQGTLTGEETQAFMDVYRILVAHAPCPAELQGSIFAQFQDYVASVDLHTFTEECIQRFEWSTGLPDPGQLRADIVRLLREQGRAHLQEEAQLLTDVLIVHVFHLLTQPTEKKLTVEGLEHLLHERSMTEVDRRLLTRLVSFVEQAESYLPRLVLQVDTTAAGIAALQSQLSQLLSQLMPHSTGLQTRFLPMPFPPTDEPPLPSLGCVPRTALIQTLWTRLADIAWLNITGAAGMGKTFAARLLAEKRGLEHTVWISLRSEYAKEGIPRYLDLHLLRIASLPDHLDIAEVYNLGALPFSQLARQVAHRLGAERFLVIDDLPDLLTLPQLSSKLLELAVALQDVGGRLLTTSQRSVPTAITEHLDTAIVECPIPPMTSQDIDEMLTVMGAPASLHHPSYLNVLYAGTHGHPALIVATLSFLRRMEWSHSADQIVTILTGDPTSEVRAETRRKILHLLPNDHVRELLFRLSLIGAPFDPALVRAIAAVDPSIPRPMELLPELIGPWLSALSADHFEVSPLLSDAGPMTLDAAVQQYVHHAIAMQYLKMQTLNPSQAFRIVSHLIGAHDWRTLAAFLGQLVLQIREKTHAETFEIITLLFTSTWPDDMPLSSRVLFRAAQMRVLDLLGKPTETLIADFDIMIQQVEALDPLAAWLALWTVGPFNPAADPAAAAHRALQACRLCPRLPIEAQQSLPPIPLEALVWMRLPGIRTYDDIRGLLSVLAEMTEDERRAAFTYEGLSQAPYLLMDQCYALEAANPANVQDWQPVLALVDEALRIGQLPGGRPLLKPAIRVKAIILADYMEQPQEGLVLLEEAPADSDGHERFLLYYTTACILLAHDTPEAALEHYQRALAEASTAYVPLHFDALRCAAESAGRIEQWQLARSFVLRAMQLLKPIKLVYERLEMIGELAWAYWSRGNRTKACRALCALVRELIRREDFGDPRFREVFRKTGHVLGWITSIVTQEKPPLHALDGQPCAAPFAGWFSRSRPQLGDLPSLYRCEALLPQLARFASGCGLYGLARRKLVLAKDLAQSEGSSFLSHMINSELAWLAARKERYGEALRLMLSGIRTLPVSERLRDHDINVLLNQIAQAQPDHLWNAWPRERRQAAERLLYWSVIGPALARLLAKKASPEAYITLVTELRALFQQCERDLVELQYWLHSLRELHIAFSPLAIRETILDQIRHCPESEPEFNVLLYLALSRMSNATLAEIYEAQTYTFVVLLRFLPVTKLMAEDMAIYLLEYWKDIAVTPAFALHNPQTCQEMGAVLITGNRTSGDDSLEQMIRDHAGADSLPVVTIGDPQRLVRDRAYASECAIRLLDLLERIETLRGTGRLFIP